MSTFALNTVFGSVWSFETRRTKWHKRMPSDLMNDLDPMTFMRTWPVFPGDIRNVRKWTSYVKAFKSYRLTDIQTDRQVMRNHFRSRDQRWRSHHWIRHTRKPHATCKPDRSIFSRTGVMGDRSLHGGIGILYFLLLLHIRTWPVLSGDTHKMYVRQVFRKSSSDRHTEYRPSDKLRVVTSGHVSTEAKNRHY